MGSLNESLYKCYFCKENIDQYNIEEHFKTIHMFKSLDHICESCDEIFDTQNDLIKHAGIHSEKSESKLNSFEEGKSKFLPFMSSFNSEDDAFRLLDWINENLEDLRLFIKEDLKSCDDLNNQDAENEAPTEDLNHINVKNDGYEAQDEEILSQTNCESEFKEVEIEQKSSNYLCNQEVFLPDYRIENRVDQQNTLNIEQNIESDNEEESENDLNLSNKEIVDNKFPQEFIGNENSMENDTLINDPVEENDDNSEEEIMLNKCPQFISKLTKNIAIADDNDSLIEDPVEEIDDKSDLHSLLNYALDSENENGDLEVSIKKEYSCVLCSKSLSSEKHLKSHMTQIHKAVKVTENDIHHNCNLCDKSFRTAQSKRQHIRRTHESRKDYICVDCKKAFSLPKDLKRHCNGVHKNVKDFKCATCGKEFNVKDKLKRHRTVHEGQRRHQCSSCSKSFSYPSQLTDHINFVHKGQKNYKCEFCGKSYNTGSAVYSHIKTVHDGRRFKCKLCEKNFTVPRHLKTHIHTVHEGHKDHACEICGKSFGQLSTLKTHIRAVHTTQKDYKCYACGENFSKAIDFKKHIFEVHEAKNNI